MRVLRDEMHELAIGRPWAVKCDLQVVNTVQCLVRGCGQGNSRMQKKKRRKMRIPESFPLVGLSMRWSLNRSDSSERWLVKVRA